MKKEAKFLVKIMGLMVLMFGVSLMLSAAMSEKSLGF